MCEFTPMREAVETLASRSPAPDFGQLKRRAIRRGHRRVVMVAAAVIAVITGSALVGRWLEGDVRSAPVIEQPKPTLSPAPNGWVAIDASQGGSDIYLARPGMDPRRLEIPGSDSANDACPAWSPDGKRLLIGRVTGTEETGYSTPELVVVPVDRNGAAGTATVISLDGFEAIDEVGDRPCGVWAPDGRWVALAGKDEVWVVDTQTRAIRKVPAPQPSDLEWRPGSDELAIAGHRDRDANPPTQATPVTIYSLSTGERHQLGSVEAAQITWSPDGTMLAYTRGREVNGGELRVVDADGGHDRTLVTDLIGPAIHGIGPVWSTTGDRIAYQRLQGGKFSGERHEVVLVDVPDGTQTVIAPPHAGGQAWYPYTVTWSPDGTNLLYAGWTDENDTLPEGVITVPVDRPADARVLLDGIRVVPNYFSHRWIPIQMWGRQPG